MNTQPAVARRFNVACVQLCADTDLKENLRQATHLIEQACEAGAELICLPEYFAGIEPDDQLMLESAYDEARHPALRCIRELAERLAVWVLIGSLPVKRDAEKVHNRSFLIGADGQVVTRYDKIHLFDVGLAGGESYRESATVAAGAHAVLASTPWGALGLSVCYDLRFAALYRRLAQAGAAFLTVPAAFTRTTGEVHWHVLLRARAIETGCYVFAPCQNGVRRSGRATYGHSLIVDPWGQVLADAGEAAGFVIASVDPERVAEARLRIPSLQHDRPITGP